MTSKGRKSDFDLPTLDDLFSTQQERDEAKLDKIRDIPIAEIDDFPNHPFHVRDDEDMLQLVESIKEHGVMTPAVLRVKDDGRFEIVAGHRRKRACELAGLDTLRSEVKHIRSIFNNDFTEIILADDTRVGYKTYDNGVLIWKGRYPSREGQRFLRWDAVAGHFDAMRKLGMLRSDIKSLLSQDGQLQYLADAAGANAPAFVFPQEIIDNVLTRGSNVAEGKMRIYEQFQKSLSRDENIRFLKNEYGIGGGSSAVAYTGISEMHDGKGIELSFGFDPDRPRQLLKWNYVEKRIRELISLDRYLNDKEKDNYPSWLERTEQRRVEQAEEARRREEERRRQMEMETSPEERLLNEGVQHSYEYRYHLGDTVYIGASSYELLSIDDDRVMLFDSNFPLFNTEMPRAEFEAKVQENPLNNHLRILVEQKGEPKEASPSEENRSFSDKLWDDYRRAQDANPKSDIKEMLDDLTTRDRRVTYATVTLVHTADTKKQLDSDTKALMNAASGDRCQMGILKFQQMDGLNTALPLSTMKIDNYRTLTTESLTALHGFRVQNILHTNGNYYGQNVISNNLIMADRRELLNGNAFILGVSGGGKSFMAKQDIATLKLSMDCDIIIIDPEREYSPLVRAMNGEVIHISATSRNHINPMDMSVEYGDGANPVILKSEFIMSLCEQLIGTTGLGAIQKSIIDRCTAAVYRDYQQRNYTGTVPTLRDFRAELMNFNWL